MLYEVITIVLATGIYPTVSIITFESSVNFSRFSEIAFTPSNSAFANSGSESSENSLLNSMSSSVVILIEFSFSKKDSLCAYVKIIVDIPRFFV